MARNFRANPKHGFFSLLITVLLIKEWFSLLILGSCVPVPLFNKGRDNNCQWKENVQRFSWEVVGTNLLLNHIKLCFLFPFVFCKSQSYLLVFINLASHLSKKTWRLGVLEVKCCMINQGDTFYVINSIMAFLSLSCVFPLLPSSEIG